MAYLVVSHKVQSYAKWKEVYDRHAEIRAGMGCTGGQVIRTDGDPCQVVVVLEWKDKESAEAFVNRTDLDASPEEAGVMDEPGCWYLDTAEKVKS